MSTFDAGFRRALELVTSDDALWAAARTMARNGVPQDDWGALRAALFAVEEFALSDPMWLRRHVDRTGECDNRD